MASSPKPRTSSDEVTPLCTVYKLFQKPPVPFILASVRKLKAEWAKGFFGKLPGGQ